MSKKDRAKQERAAEKKAKSELKRRLMSYSAIAGAALIAAGHAAGGVVYSGPQSITVDAGNPSVGIDFDGGGAEALIQHISSSSTTSTGPTTSSGTWTSRLRIGPPGKGNPIAVLATTGDGYVARLDASNNIGPNPGDTLYWKAPGGLLAGATGYWYYYTTGPTTSTTTSSSYGNFLNAKGCIGVRFDSGAGIKFGWIECEGSDAESALITGWAYETSGGAIHCGATSGGDPVVPEPGGLALLATGAAGLASMRRKRQAA